MDAQTSQSTFHRFLRARPFFLLGLFDMRSKAIPAAMIFVAWLPINALGPNGNTAMKDGPLLCPPAIENNDRSQQDATYAANQTSHLPASRPSTVRSSSSSSQRKAIPFASTRTFANSSGAAPRSRRYLFVGKPSSRPSANSTRTMSPSTQARTARAELEVVSLLCEVFIPFFYELVRTLKDNRFKFTEVLRPHTIIIG